MLKRWQFWLGAGISALFLAFALRNMHLGDVWTSIRTAQYLWIVPGVAVYFFGVWVRTWRWDTAAEALHETVRFRHGRVPDAMRSRIVPLESREMTT